MKTYMDLMKELEVELGLYWSAVENCDLEEQVKHESEINRLKIELAIA